MNNQTIEEFKQSVRKGRSKKFNDWKYSKGTLAGKTVYQPKQK